MASHDPYTILGISKSASDEEVKRAYRKLAHKHHPDKKGGSSEKFKEVNEAYQILSDPAKRRQYDQFGFAGNGSYKGQGPFGGGRSGFNTDGFEFNFGGGGIEDIFDIFSSAFSSQGGSAWGGGGRRPSRGEDLHFQVELNQHDLGQKKIFEYEAYTPCKECATTGVAPGSKLIDCTTCKGAGRVQQNVRTPFGTFSQAGMCGTCLGRKKMPEKTCTVCHGHGRVHTKKKMELHIPSDITNDYNVVMPKQGNAGEEGMPPGDLLINLKVR